MNSADLISCGAPGCTSSRHVRCSRCDRPLCTWHHVQAFDENAQLEPVCFPTCGADFWKGPGVDEVRPRLVIT